jgi:hypothetical protein
VEKGSERVGTGRFDVLDDPLLSKILVQVPFIHRLACATSVCKSWRSLRENGALWTELLVEGNTGSFHGEWPRTVSK